MARRGKKKSRGRSRNTGFNIRTAIFAYANLHVVSKAITNVGPWTFLTDGYLNQQTSVGHGSNIITLKEVFSGQHLGPQFASDQAMTYQGMGPTGEGGLGASVQENLMNNGAPAIIALIGLKVLDKGLQKVGLYRNFNKMVKDTGMKGTVKA
jgi:hypothetical protein